MSNRNADKDLADYENPQHPTGIEKSLEKTNDLKRTGVLVNDPDWVIQAEVDGKKNGELQGGFGSIGSTELDYAFHKLYGVTLNDKKSFYRNREVKAHIHYRKQGELRKVTYIPDGDRWVKEEEAK